MSFEEDRDEMSAETPEEPQAAPLSGLVTLTLTLGQARVLRGTAGHGLGELERAIAEDEAADYRPYLQPDEWRSMDRYRLTDGTAALDALCAAIARAEGK